MIWTLSDDRRRLRMTFLEAEATRVITVGWTDPATEAELAYAIRNAEELRNLNLVGQTTDMRRFKTPVGTFYLSRHTGPPTWWLPKLGFRRWKVRFGWLRRAYVLSWRTL